MTGPKTDQSGQIQKRRADRPEDKLLGLLAKMGPEIAKALPRHLNPDRMARIVSTALRVTPKLGDCTPVSFLGCVLQAAQLGLEPNTLLGHSYLIPFANRRQRCTDCTLIIGYKGFIDLARRSGMVSNVYAYAVREGDVFSYQLGTDRKVTHIPSEDPDREQRPITHVYAVAQIRDGEPEFQVLTRAQVEARRKRSRAKDSGPWVTDYEPMALKTAVRALAPWIPQSAEYARAAALDEAADRGAQMGALDEDVKAALLSSGVAEPAELETEGETADEQPAEPADEPADPAAGPDGLPEPGVDG